MAITINQRNDITKLVVAMFNAAPGATYLSELVSFYEASGNSLPALARALSETTAFKAINPSFQLASEFATSFLTPLGLQGNQEAIDFITAKFNAGVNKGQIILEAGTALNNSTSPTFAAAKAILNNKTDVADYFSVAKGVQQTDVNQLKSVISSVTADTATIASAKTAIDNGAGAPGSNIFTLTTGTDSLTGSSTSDVFNALDTTLNATDTINGGAGTDSLNITVSNASALAAATISNIETFNVRALATLNTTDLSSYTGLTAFNSDRSTAAVTVTNLANGGSFGVIGNGSVTNGASDFGSANAATAQTLNILNGTVGAGAITLTGTGVLATTITSTGGTNVVGAVTAAATSTSLKIDAASALTTGAVTAAGVTGANLSISGAGAVTTNLAAVAATALTITSSGAVATGTLNNATVTVDASTATGAVTTTLGTSTGMKFTGGSGNDVVTAGAILAGTALVDAGAGTADRIVFTASNQLTAVSGAKYTNFEVLQANTGVTADASLVAGITALRSSGNTVFTNVSATQAAAVTVIASGTVDIGVKDATKVGQIDSVTVTTSATNAAVAIGTLTVAGVETVNLVSGTGTGLTSITTLAHQDWSTLNLSGSSAITITSTATASIINSVVNGSTATGVLTLDFGLTTTNGLSITGGSAADLLTGTGLADVISGGAGNDTITGGLGADSLTGGAGNDTFAFGTAGSVAGTSMDKIADFTAKTTTAGDILTFGAATTLLAADATAAAAGTNATQTAGGLLGFAAADNTLALKITTVQADTQLDAIGSVAFFVDGANSYVYYAGAATGNTDDQIIELTGITTLATITAGATTQIA